MTQAEFIRMILLSYSVPRAGSRALISLRLPLPLVAQTLVLMAILLTLIGALEQAFAPTEAVPQIADGNLLVVVVIHTILLLVPAALIHVIGDRTGSTSRFADALLLVLWAQFLVLPFQLLATLTLGLGSNLTDVVLFIYVAVTFWLLTHFVTELHGYTSRLNVFLGIVAVSIVLGLMLIPFIDPSFAGA
jgi:hypothetical protein